MGEQLVSKALPPFLYEVKRELGAVKCLPISLGD